VEIASEPNTSATSVSPAAIDPDSSVIRCCGAGHFEDRPARIRADARSYRSRVVVGSTQGSYRLRRRRLELADAADGIDGCRHCDRVDPGVSKCALGRFGGELDRRQSPVVRRIQLFGGLTAADEHRRAGV
jgi:hypothetical protein